MSPHPSSKKAKAQRAKRAQARAERAERTERGDAGVEARMARQAEQRRQRERARRRRTLRTAALVAAVVIPLLVAGWLVFRPDPELAGVERPPDLGGGHVANASYDSATPTSGPHDASAPRCSTYRDGLELPLAVHALEHGTVILWYDADSPELVEELDQVADRWDSHVIVAANPDLDTPVVATAWNRRFAFEADDPRIAEFVEIYRQRGPEKIDCPR